LTHFGLTTVILDQIEEKDLISLLDKHNMDWGKKEVADFLIAFQRRIHLIYQRKQLPFMSIFNPVKHFRFKFLIK
jgi:hypothetical protein